MDYVGFWTIHGIFGGMLFLMFAALSPRLHLFVGGIVFAAFNLTVLMPGFIVFLLWVLLPRTLLAYSASMFFWETNPVLVFIAWCFAIFGEILEKLFATLLVAAVVE